MLLQEFLVNAGAGTFQELFLSMVPSPRLRQTPSPGGDARLAVSFLSFRNQSVLQRRCEDPDQKVPEGFGRTGGKFKFLRKGGRKTFKIKRC